ncbi:hypothetical protein BFG60_3418 [Microcystis aeruginosa NIES-98]|nr:hypothetical protein BFG60_3418 [Microcystis aeruginosa NIES-98]
MPSIPPAPLNKGGADRRGIPPAPLNKGGADRRGDLTIFNTYLLKTLLARFYFISILVRF